MTDENAHKDGSISPYWPVISHPLLRRLLPGMAISELGDGMSLVAVSWLALQLAPADGHATWVALAVAAYSLPATLGAVVLGRFLGRRDSVELVYWNAGLRGVVLGLIPIADILGFLTPVLFIVLLAVSSLLHAWGSAGQFALIAEVLPQPLHVPANAVLTIFSEVSTIAGPPLAGLLIAGPGAPAVIALDAISFLILGASFLSAEKHADKRVELAKRPATRGRSIGIRTIVRDRTMLGLIGMTFLFFLFFGPVYVALPVHVTGDLHGSAALLGVFYTAFGVGSLIGAVATGYAGRLPLWPATVAVVVGFGVTLLPIGLGASTPVSLVAFAVGGLIWAPYMSISRALFQRRAEPGSLPGVLAANNAVIVAAVPLGTIVGGPLVAHLGARHTMLAVALATIALGCAAATAVAAAKSRTATQPKVAAKPETASRGGGETASPRGTD